MAKQAPTVTDTAADLRRRAAALEVEIEAMQKAVKNFIESAEFLEFAERSQHGDHSFRSGDGYTVGSIAEVHQKQSRTQAGCDH